MVSFAGDLVSFAGGADSDESDFDPLQLVRAIAAKETLIKPRSSVKGGLNLIHDTATRDDSASLPL